jgi:hypothetical protein
MMVKRFLILLIAASALPATAQSSIDGYWIYRARDYGSVVLSLKQSGETVTGLNEDRRTAFNGSLIGPKLHLEQVTSFHGQPFTLVIDGVRKPNDEFEASEIAPGVRPGESFKTEGSLQRVDRDAIYPQRAAPPTLVDQPDNGLGAHSPHGEEQLEPLSRPLR